MLSADATQLCLVNNDPVSTFLVTADGIPLYSIQTPNLPSASDDSAAPDSQILSHRYTQRSPITTVTRLNKHYQCTGNVETVIGVVEYHGSARGTNVKMCNDDLDVHIAPDQTARTIDSGEGQEVSPGSSDSWAFMGPESKSYKWHLFCQSPVMMTDDNSLTPLARYRRAKLGIVSRPRRAFLEIFPAGLEIIDLIVITFVGFMKQRVLINGGQALTTLSISSVFHNYAQTSRSLPTDSDS